VGLCAANEGALVSSSAFRTDRSEPQRISIIPTFFNDSSRMLGWWGSSKQRRSPRPRARTQHSHSSAIRFAWPLPIQTRPRWTAGRPGSCFKFPSYGCSNRLDSSVV